MHSPVYSMHFYLFQRKKVEKSKGRDAEFLSLPTVIYYGENSACSMRNQQSSGGGKIPSGGSGIWCHFWSEDNNCVSEYFTAKSPLLSVLISHWVSFFSRHTRHYFVWIQERPRQSLLTVLTSQRDKVLSAEQVSTVLEKGRNSMLLTDSLWPRRVYLHLSLQEKRTGMQHPPRRVLWTTDNFRVNEEHVSCTSPATLWKNEHWQRFLMRALHHGVGWYKTQPIAVCFPAMKAGAGRYKEMRGEF